MANCFRMRGLTFTFNAESSGNNFNLPSFINALGNCLLSISQRPGMWLDDRTPPRSLSKASAFVTGFQHGQMNVNDSFTFEEFTPWVAAHYRKVAGPMNGFWLIHKKVGEDDALAFDEFVRLLPLFLKDYEEIGKEGIWARYKKVIEEITGRQID